MGLNLTIVFQIDRVRQEPSASELPGVLNKIVDFCPPTQTNRIGKEYASHQTKQNKTNKQNTRDRITQAPSG